MVGQAYNFKQARQRIQELTLLYRQAKHAEADEMTLMLLEAEIDEIEREIQEAHKNEKAAAGHSDSKKIIDIGILARRIG